MKKVVRVRVRFLKAMKLADGHVGVGDQRTVNGDEARFLFGIGAVEIVSGDAGLPKDAKTLERGGLMHR